MPLRHGQLVELRYLRYFVSVAEEGSITKAAARLRVAQPALSRQLRLLEHEIGSPLMGRNSRGVVLTEAGLAFAGDAQRILDDVDAAIVAAKARSRGTKGELAIGYAPSPTAEILPSALRILETSAPDVSVALHDMSGDELLTGLQKGKLNCAVMVEPGNLLPASLVFRPLKQYRQCVAFGPEHAFARMKRVPLERVAREPLVTYDQRHYTEYMQTLLAFLAPVTKTPRIVAECDGMSTLVAAVLAGRGVAIVPEVFRRLSGNRVRLRAIHPPGAPLVVGYAHRVDIPISPVVRRFVEALKKASR
ncbi:MAG TPA: LysR family transcriptional regulator [Opitutaceae bacterium]|nr:LysR family transcriptional regulator [Opitutaceae bacterium]